MELKRSFKGFNDLELVADEFGDPNTASRFVLFAHGGGQTRHAWQSSARLLADKGMHALSLDLRGHGESAWAADADYSMEAFAHDLIAVAAKLPKPPVLVGASLGGISGMIAAGELGKNAFEALVLVDITPKMDERGVEKIVSFMGQDLEHGFESLEAAAQSIATYLPHRKPSKNLDGLKKNLRLGEDGRYRWHWDPKFMTGTSRSSASKDPDRLSQQFEVFSKGIQQNLVPKLAELKNLPILFVSGEKDQKYQKIGVELAKSSSVVLAQVVVDAGHRVPWENPKQFVQTLGKFINSLNTC